MANVPTFSGKDSVFRLFSNGIEIVLLAKTWELGPNCTNVNDGVNGEDRDRLQTITNYYEGTLTCFQNDLKALNALLSNTANNDAEALPFDQAFVASFKIIGGPKNNFIGKEMTIDNWRENQGGRTERVMLTIPFRCRYFDPIASAG